MNYAVLACGVGVQDEKSIISKRGENMMKKVFKRIFQVLLVLLFVVVIAVASFFGLYLTRIQTMNSIEQLTNY